jgi:limonene-1,2-epoxide hydrolase
MATPTTPSEVIHVFMDAMAVKDYDTALKYVADDCEYDNVPMGKVYGPAGVRGVLEPFFAPTIENEFVIKRELPDGNTVMLDRHLLATGWVELPVTGIFEVKGGKITLYRDYFDLATIMSKWPAAA